MAQARWRSRHASAPSSGCSSHLSEQRRTGCWPARSRCSGLRRLKKEPSDQPAPVVLSEFCTETEDSEGIAAAFGLADAANAISYPTSVASDFALSSVMTTTTSQTTTTIISARRLRRRNGHELTMEGGPSVPLVADMR